MGCGNKNGASGFRILNPAYEHYAIFTVFVFELIYFDFLKLKGVTSDGKEI